MRFWSGMPSAYACLVLIGMANAETSATAPTTLATPAPALYLALPGQFPDESATPLLVRELARQALLIAARDELGLQTRDAVTREWEPAADGHAPADAGGLPVLILDVHRNHERKTIDTQLYTLDGERKLVLSDSMPAPGDDYAWVSIRGALTACEPMSRGKELEELKKLGFGGSGISRAKAAGNEPVPAEVDELLYQTTLMAPFSALQQTHAAIYQSGESPARLGALVRAYANLGQLTRFQWSTIPVVFTARSLLYAQRMVQNDPNSPFPYYHRAYANAMTGLHADALADLQRAHQLQEQLQAAGKPAPPVPDWVELLEPFSKHDTKRLSAIQNDHRKAIAALMAFLDCENSGSIALLVKAGGSTLQVNPGCFRVIDGMMEHLGVSSGHMLTEAAPQIMFKTLPTEIGRLKTTPQSVKDALAGAQGDADPVGNMASTCRSFLTASEEAEPSFALAGRMLQETNFAHVKRRTSFMADAWGVDCSEYVKSIAPLIADHPLRAYIEAFQKPHAMRAQALSQLEVNDPQFQMHDLLEMLYQLKKQDGHMTGPAGFLRVYESPTATASDTEAMLYPYWEQNGDTIKNMAPSILLRSPYSGAAAATTIRLDWKSAEPHADEWAQKFQDEPAVLSALAAHFLTEKQTKKAELLLRHRLEIAPDLKAIEQLAALFLEKGDEEEWLATMKRELDQPDYGLDHSSVENEIAWHFMNTGQYSRARPYADASLRDSYSGWSMECAATAAEYEGDFVAAEQIKKEEDERYENPVWYIWCRRTGRGDLAGAQKRADAWIAGQIQLDNHGSYPEIGELLFMEHRFEQAKKYYELALHESNNCWFALQVADICDQLKDRPGRDAALHYAVDHCKVANNGETYKTLAAYAQLVLDAGDKLPEKAVVNELLRTGEDTNLYQSANAIYFRARQFHVSGNTKVAKGLYEQIAGMEVSNLWSYQLACAALADMGETTTLPKVSTTQPAQ